MMEWARSASIAASCLLSAIWRSVVEVAHQPAVTFQMPVDPLPDVRYQNLQCDACKPRCLQLKATSLSSWQSSQRIP